MIATESDLDLLHRYRDGRDAAAFTEIVRRYAGVVFATCLRILGDSARAEEVSQETFFRMLQRPPLIDQSLGAWLHRAATNLSVDVLRSDQSRRKRELDYVVENVREHEPSTWAELSPYVDEALADLPEEARSLLVQHYLMGRSQTDIAAETGTSAATVCRRVQGAIQDLQRRLRLKGLCAATPMLAALMHDASAKVVPVQLARELGKMAMLSGARSIGNFANTARRIAGKTARRGFLNRVGIPYRIVVGLVGVALVCVSAAIAANYWHGHPPRALDQWSNPRAAHSIVNDHDKHSNANQPQMNTEKKP